MEIVYISEFGYPTNWNIVVSSKRFAIQPFGSHHRNLIGPTGLRLLTRILINFHLKLSLDCSLSWAIYVKVRGEIVEYPIQVMCHIPMTF